MLPILKHRKMKVKSKNNKKPKKVIENKQNHAAEDKNEVEIEKPDVIKSPVVKGKKKNKKVKLAPTSEKPIIEILTIETETSVEKKAKKRKAGNDEVATPAEDSPASPKKKEKKKKKAKANDSIKTDDPVESSETDPPKKKKKKKKKDADSSDEKDEDEGEQKDTEEKTYAYNREDEKKTVFCGNIPNESGINKNKIKELFAQYGKIKTIRMRSETGNVIFSKKNKTLCTSFNAYVVFETIEDAKKSLQLNGFKLVDNHIRVNMANDKNSAFQNNKGTIFVGNLPFDATEKEVRELFTTIGEVEYVRIIPRKGIAYICYKKGVSIVDALKLNEAEFQGRNLRVTRCETKQKQEKKKLYARDPKTGRKVKLRAKKAHKINDNFVSGRGTRSINNPIIKKIKESQKAKFNKFTEAANQLGKKDLFRRGGKIDKDNRDLNRTKLKQKKSFFGSKVDDGSQGGGGKKIKKGKVNKVAKDQKIIAKKLKSAALRK